MRTRCSVCAMRTGEKVREEVSGRPDLAPTCTTRFCSRTGKLPSAGAHTLKGVAQNLGFERLYQVSAVLTEAMRGEKPLEDRSLLDAVEQQDAAIRRAISELE